MPSNDDKYGIELIDLVIIWLVFVVALPYAGTTTAFVAGIPFEIPP